MKSFVIGAFVLFLMILFFLSFSSEEGREKSVIWNAEGIKPPRLDKTVINNDVLTVNVENHAVSLENKKKLKGNTHADSVAKGDDWRNLSDYTSDQLAEARGSDDLWDFSIPVNADDLPLDEYEKNDGRIFFKGNPAKFALSTPGDRLSASLPDGTDIELQVMSVGSTKLGGVQVNGVIDESSGSSFSVVTANNMSIGHINTDKNTYSFEIFGEKGWIHSSGALFTGESDPVVPPTGAHHPEDNEAIAVP